MRKLVMIVVMLPLLFGCDPVSTLEANITNASSQNISITLVSSFEADKTLQIAANETVLFQEGSDIGNFIAPSLIQYDSVYIENTSDEVIKVFLPDTAGKNIYNIDDDWSQSEPSKRVFNYDFEINDSDL